MRHRSGEGRPHVRTAWALFAVVAVALIAGCGSAGPLTVGASRAASPSPGGGHQASSAAGGHPAGSSPAGGSGGGPMVAQAKALIATPPGPHLVSCFAGTLSQFIASGQDPKEATDKLSWQLLKANGIATNWNVYLGAKRSGCPAAIDGRASSSTVGEVIYTFKTAAEPVDAFDSNMFHTATAPPAPRPGMTIGPRTGFGTYSEAAAEANGSHSLVWAEGNALVAVVAPSPAEVRQISQAIKARM